MAIELLLEFTAEVIEWRGPAPFYFLRIPQLEADKVNYISAHVSYGWGVIPSDVILGSTNFYTALIPKDGSYLVPLKKSIRIANSIELGDKVTVKVQIPSSQ